MAMTTKGSAAKRSAPLAPPPPDQHPVNSASFADRDALGAHEYSHAGPSPEEITEMIAVVAYRRAQQRGFAPGQELDDWLAAEDEIKHSLERAAG
jgi:hypothetical protein